MHETKRRFSNVILRQNAEQPLLQRLFAPRGRDRIYDLGMHIAQMYLSPFDKLIGIIGEAGSGKSMLIKGMFPGLELTNDDNGVNTRPLPILDIDQQGFLLRTLIILTYASRRHSRRWECLPMQF